MSLLAYVGANGDGYQRKEQGSIIHPREQMVVASKHELLIVMLVIDI